MDQARRGSSSPLRHPSIAGLSLFLAPGLQLHQLTPASLALQKRRSEMGGQQNALHQLVSFILGASAAAVLLFFLTTATSGARFTGISSWANGTTGFDDDAPVQAAPATRANHADAKVNS